MDETDNLAEGDEYKRSELFKKAISILEMQATSRSSAHISSLREYFEKEFQGFFMKVKSLNDDLNDDVVNQFLAALKLYKFHNNGIVCDYGDKGKEFFVILEGSVDVSVPDEEDVCLKPIAPKMMQR